MKLAMVFIMVFTIVSGVQAAITVTGNVEPADPATWTSSTSIYIGRSADGSVTVNGGSSIASGGGVLGGFLSSQSGVAGSATVDGSGSTWTNSYLTIGNYGIGSLSITNAGVITTSSGASIGANSTGIGIVTVDGAGSEWDTGSGWLYVGDYGTGTLTISSGGVVNSSTSVIGNYTGSGSATVTGSGSQWINSGELAVGFEGVGSLTIEDGGAVSNTTGYIGLFSGSTGTVSVNNGTWTNSGDLYIGDDGTGSLNISNGGQVFASDADIGSAGTLSGDGVLSLGSGTGVLTNYGTIAPGNSIGTLTIVGDVIFENGSTLEMEIDNAGNSDLLDVSGDVTINTGSTLVINSNGEAITDGKEYTLIEAGGTLSGQFSIVDTALVNWASGVTPGSVSYPGTSVVMIVGTPSVTPFDDLSLLRTANQRACGSAIELISNAGGSLGGITGALQSIVADEDLRTAYDQLSGQTRPSIAPIAASGVSAYLGILSNRLGCQWLDPDCQTEKTVGKSTFWAKGFGLTADRDSKDGVNANDYDMAGAGLGVDYQLTETLMTGVTFGYADTDVDYSSGRDNSRIDSLYTGLYADYTGFDGYVEAMLVYADLDSETRRFVDFVSEQNRGKFDGYEVAGQMEAALNYIINDFLVQPVGAFKFGYQKHDAYREAGGASALRFDEQTFESYQGILGVRVCKTLYDKNNRKLWGQVRAKWAHEFGDDTADVTVNFISEPDYQFTIRDIETQRDSAMIGAGFNYQSGKNLQLYADFDTQLNGDATVNTFSGGLRVAW